MELWDNCFSLVTNVMAGEATLICHHVPLHAITVLLILALTLSEQGEQGSSGMAQLHLGPDAPVQARSLLGLGFKVQGSGLNPQNP